VSLKRHLVTYSEVETFRTCPRKHHFRYRERLRLQRSGARTRIGQAYHRGVEVGVLAGFRWIYDARGSNEDAARVAIAAGVTAAIEQVDLDWKEVDASVRDDAREDAEREDAEARRVLPWMIEHYFTRTAADFSRFVPLAVERVFEVPIDHRGARGGPLWHAGVMDLAVFDLDFGDILLTDHKTVEVAPWNVEKRLELDPQMAGYIAALRALQRRGKVEPLFPMTAPLGLDTAKTGRVVYSVMRRARPEEPKINQDGTVSIAACDTTAALDAAAIEKQAEPGWLAKGSEEGGARASEGEQGWRNLRLKQGALVERLEHQGDRFFARTEFWRSDEEIEQWRREMYVEAGRIRRADRDPSERTRSPGACTMPWSPPCEYRLVCLQDAPETRSQYRVAEVAHEEIERRKDGA